jgi:hypothetical protein
MINLVFWLERTNWNASCFAPCIGAPSLISSCLVDTGAGRLGIKNKTWGNDEKLVIDATAIDFP